MATLPNLNKGVTKDSTPPATDTVISPITIPDGTTLLTTKLHNEVVDNVDKLIDYVSGDAAPDFIPQNAISNLVVNLAAKASITHASTHKMGGLDEIKLDDLGAPDDNPDLDATILRHGLMSKLDKAKLDGIGVVKGIFIDNIYHNWNEQFRQIFGQDSLTETLPVQYKAPFGFTWKKLTMNVESNSDVGATTIVSVINNVVGNQTVTIPAGFTGIVEDTINFDTVNEGDFINYRKVSGNGDLFTKYVSTVWEAT